KVTNLQPNEYGYGGAYYFPTDFRAAYHVPSGQTGTGQHIGITLWFKPPTDAALAAWGCDVTGHLIAAGASCPVTAYPYPSQAAGSLVLHAPSGASTMED